MAQFSMEIMRLTGSVLRGNQHIISLLVGVFAAYLFQMSAVEVLQGPLALSLGGIDLSWLAGFVVAFAAYAVSHKLRRTVDVSASTLTSPVRGE